MFSAEDADSPPCCLAKDLYTFVMGEDEACREFVKWNDKKPVFDIRAWRVSDRDGLQYPLRGITFSKEELIKLREILNSIDVNCIDEYM